MKLPTALGSLFGKKQENKEVFASILLDVDYVAAALWEMGEKGIPHILATSTESVAADTWEDRLNATDDALARVENKAGTTDYAKTVLGLPHTYLTESGEITTEIRAHIKEVTKELELEPIGFVSIHQVLMYNLKKEEGVPPSVIFLGISHHAVSLSLYKVGALTGQKTIAYSGDIAIQVEELLKQFKDLEVLPARILLYGHDGKDLNDVKSDLLKYPWTTRVNFLHFPKIEIVTPEEVVSAISLAGASELASEMKPSFADDLPAGEAGATEGKEETVEAEEIEEGEDIAREEEPNVVVVEPSHFGFKKNVDVLEETVQPVQAASSTVPKKRFSMKLPTVNFAAFITRFRAGGVIAIIGVVAVLFLIGWFIYWTVPHATVTVLESPKSINDSQQITIDPTATVVDAQNKIIPGSKQEQSVSEDKTIAVTGKKNVGDPAKGSVTIYNKTLSGKSLPKGTVLTAGSLEFTLDGDISVASASEDLGGRTYGKANVAITASQIGANSNMAAATTFTLKGFSGDDMTANNPQAFTGGTSREVTVVTRADYDALVAAAQKD
jgi:Baseplate J-like protein